MSLWRWIKLILRKWIRSNIMTRLLSTTYIFPYILSAKHDYVSQTKIECYVYIDLANCSDLYEKLWQPLTFIFCSRPIIVNRKHWLRDRKPDFQSHKLWTNKTTINKNLVKDSSSYLIGCPQGWYGTQSGCFLSLSYFSWRLFSWSDGHVF